MPHHFEGYRDIIDSLIGPIEEIMSKCDKLPIEVRLYVLGGLEQAKDTLEDTRNDIDEYEEPEQVVDAPEDDYDAFGDDNEDEDE